MRSLAASDELQIGCVHRTRACYPSHSQPPFEGVSAVISRRGRTNSNCPVGDNLNADGPQLLPQLHSYDPYIGRSEALVGKVNVYRARTSW